MKVHILNGDALAKQFPKDIPGERLIARECLVDGPVSGKTLSDLFRTRSRFLKKAYEVPADEYRTKSRSVFLKIRDLPEDADISLWFEDDLFCQVNLWFVCSLLGEREQLYLVRPTTHVRFGFGGMDGNALRSAHENRHFLKPVYRQVFADMWTAFQEEDRNALLTSSRSLPPGYAFVTAAAEAHVDRFPAEGPGRPEKILQEIMNDVGSESFGPVFQEFNKRAAIYGFGDLQVRRLYENLREN